MKIKETREKTRYGLIQAAEILKVTPQTVIRIEKGNLHKQVFTLLHMAKLYGVNITDFDELKEEER